MKELYPLLSVLFLIFGCSQKPLNEYNVTELILDDITNTYSKKFSNETPNGIVYQLIGGSKYILGEVKDGKVSGLGTKWYENGQKESEETFKDGKRDGLGTWWYENGQKKSEGKFEDDKKDGLWKSYYDNGQLKYEWNYKEGELISQKCWDEDGNEKECE
jgi:antitoxin component YwqK of YwqJK toxin-antitoxin module